MQYLQSCVLSNRDEAASQRTSSQGNGEEKEGESGSVISTIDLCN